MLVARNGLVGTAPVWAARATSGCTTRGRATGADRAEIAPALQGVAHGEVVFSAGIASRVLAFFAAGPAAAALEPFPSLTGREREILDLVARGLTNAEIARRPATGGRAGPAGG